MSSRMKPTTDPALSSLCGILSIDKPSGMTSRDVVNAVQRLVRPLKVGHAGTLDPLATGVLVLCLGPATRLISYVQQMRKRYRATFQLGVTSETDDVEAKLEEVESPRQPDRDEIERALANFRGTIWQTPPRYSAIKVRGKRAYQLARTNQNFELEPRQITIDHVELLDYQFPVLSLDIQCSSGTYIRSLGRDLGQLLETGAVMSALRRTAIGRFLADDAHPLDELTPESLIAWLLPSSCAVEYLPTLRATADQVARIRHGSSLLLSELLGPSSVSPPRDVCLTPGSSEFVALDKEGKLVAIMKLGETGMLRPRKCFS